MNTEGLFLNHFCLRQCCVWMISFVSFVNKMCQTSHFIAQYSSRTPESTSLAFSGRQPVDGIKKITSCAQESFRYAVFSSKGRFQLVTGVIGNQFTMVGDSDILRMVSAWTKGVMTCYGQHDAQQDQCGYQTCEYRKVVPDEVRGLYRKCRIQTNGCDMAALAGHPLMYSLLNMVKFMFYTKGQDLEQLTVTQKPWLDVPRCAHY